MILSKIGIVILHWNNYTDTSNCLKSVLGLVSCEYKLEVVVVDNGSTDNSLNKLKTEFKSIVYLKNNANLGFAGGNNVGIKYFNKKDPDFIFILNNDTIVDRQLIKELLKTHIRTNAAIISPKIYFTKGFEFHKKRYKKKEQGKVLWYGGGAINWNTVMGYHIGVDEVDNGQFDTERDLDYATGAALFISKKALDNLTGFDERYYLYYEDIDLSVRAKQMNYKIVFSPMAYLWHNNAGSSSSGSMLQDYYITRNRLLFGMTYAPFVVKGHLIKEATTLFVKGRKWQKKGVDDYITGKFGKGSYE